MYDRPTKLDEYRDFFRNHGTKDPYIRDNFYAGEHMAVSESTGLQNDNLPLEWTVVAAV